MIAVYDTEEHGRRECEELGEETQGLGPARWGCVQGGELGGGEDVSYFRGLRDLTTELVN